PNLRPSVRAAATSIFMLSVLHVAFWAIVAFLVKTNLPPEFPYNFLFLILCCFSVGGFFGVAVSLGLFRARNWARIAAIALGAIVAFFCAFSMVILGVFILGLLNTSQLGLSVASKGDCLRILLVYLFIFALAVWWISLFCRQSVAAQFSASTTTVDLAPKKSTSPPPIALLAW